MVPPLRGLAGLDECTFQGSWVDGASCISRDTLRPSSPTSTSISTSRSASSSGTALESEPSSVWPMRTLCGSEGSTTWFLFSLCSRRRSSGTVFFLGRKREVCGTFWPAMNTCREPSRLNRMPVRMEKYTSRLFSRSLWLNKQSSLRQMGCGREREGENSTTDRNILFFVFLQDDNHKVCRF